ncbi:CBS domain-containing protein [Streptomyces sp. Li-HN-5-11]|uniref:CBS domain-containing protein n=1 Tax=Streptomyces sp. Li-HN-5-11 TaxID=3075432 RepID=UPI0028B1BE23|nr:CBS domain-containing protein [Streptomyces sp. Li-HN-5-11]WNM32097.1 CBS domain-containing protein [Streptomyces sp. Li-HN-5-11]
MRHRSVGDLMTPAAVSVRPGTPFKEIARILDEYGVTAVPVIDDQDRPVGVVSEADLLRKQTSGGVGNSAGDLMTSPAVVAEPGWHAVRAARTMERHKIKRLPVVDGDGRLIGVISRSDLVQLFLRRDRAIQEEILEDVIVRTLGLPPSALTVEVAEGRVTLSGEVERKSLVPVTVRLCDSVDGVVEVVSRLGFEWDDTVDRTARHEGPPVTSEAGRASGTTG